MFESDVCNDLFTFYVTRLSRDDVRWYKQEKMYLSSRVYMMMLCGGELRNVQLESLPPTWCVRLSLSLACISTHSVGIFICQLVSLRREWEVHIRFSSCQFEAKVQLISKRVWKVKRVQLLKMREILHLQVGQCGNQIGSKVRWRHRLD